MLMRLVQFYLMHGSMSPAASRQFTHRTLAAPRQIQDRLRAHSGNLASPLN
jgi:hypothetical protein